MAGDLRKVGIVQGHSNQNTEKNYSGCDVMDVYVMVDVSLYGMPSSSERRYWSMKWARMMQSSSERR